MENIHVDEKEFVNYDVVSSCIHPITNEPLYSETDSTLQKYNKFRNNEIDYDADASLEAVVVYEKLFPFISRTKNRVIRPQPYYNKYGLKFELGEADCEGGISFRGDTMNSVATTNRLYYLNHKDKVEEGFSWPKEALEFIDVYHTLGNFMVLPYTEGLSVNCKRGIGPSKDYFDLFMLAIYNFYEECAGREVLYKKVTLSNVLGNEEVAMFFANYLREFIEDDKDIFDYHSRLIDDIERVEDETCYAVPGWQSFVEKNLLQDYVTTEEHFQFSLPKELWEGHFDSFMCGIEYPRNDKEIKEFWTNAMGLIKKRNVRIFERLN